MTYRPEHNRIRRHVAAVTARAKFLATVDLGSCDQAPLIRQIAADDLKAARILLGDITMGDIGKPEREIELEPLEEPLTAPTTVPVPAEPVGV